MKRRLLLALFGTILLASTAPAQHFPIDDPVLRALYADGIDGSHTRELAHMLVDRIGPRLAGSENLDAATDWLVDTYAGWGVPARKEQYGTWARWRQGILHVDMLAPRVQSFEAELKAWSPGTDGPVEADVIMPPDDLSAAGVDAWLSTVRGKFVMLSAPEEMCRARQEVEANARPETVQRLAARRAAMRSAWNERLEVVSGTENPRQVTDRAVARIDSAGAAGILESRWSEGWGVNKVFDTNSRRAVAVDLSCEDYGLLFRLVARGVTPALRIEADAEFLGDVPQFNVIAELTGTELPEEYVLLSAHLDSWHAATGATDNGTGTITMLEAMRLLKAHYPRPKRTILVGHWGVEEQGLIGSRAFTEDHPEILEGMQAVFNQDNGTWRFEKIEGQGFADAASHIPAWVAALPTDLVADLEIEMPGPQANAGSDHTSFVCAGVPAFRLQSPYNEYRQYTWHTNRDTYDKIVFDDLAANATVAAMLAYMASEDPNRVGREKAVLPTNPRTGQPRGWPTCRPAQRTWDR